MKIELLNQRYFCFQLEEHELKDSRQVEIFLAALKERISGSRRQGKAALRFYLANDKLFCIHKSQFTIFNELIKSHYNQEVRNPFIQKELFDEQQQ